MLRRFYRGLAEYRVEKERRFRLFVDFMVSSYGERVTAVLFGSRARGGHNVMSDYDVLLVCDGDVFDEVRRRRPPGVQLFHVKPRELEERIGEFNTILADAAVEGVVLHDGLGIWHRVSEMVLEEARRRELEKTQKGWFRRSRA